ncbi:DUF1173 family protein [Pseudomonas sp. NPDC089734]|uniref:DUF1173 family protein n=1 Tax=Pseudomonas sp. NPDC089734 TaxID=3364469 RepID=UPI00382FC6FC
MADRHSIRVEKSTGARDYSVEFQTEDKYADKWKNVLRSAHLNKLPVSCQCAGLGPRRFAVRYMSGSDSYHLARFPDSGEEHALNCVYQSMKSNKTGLQGYSKGVVEETGDGDLRIKLTLSLRKQEAADSGEPRAERSYSPSVYAKKPAMTLLGLLHLLWTEANLNSWWPSLAGRRDMFVVHLRLIQAASRITTNRLRLDDALVVAAPTSGGAQQRANEVKVASAIRNSRRLLVIAPLAAHTKERAAGTSGFLAIKGFHGVPKLSLDQETWAAVCKRFPRELIAWAHGKRIVAIVQTDKPESASAAQALNIALMHVSEEWVPVDSLYESTIEAKLRAENRHFNKPLRFDAEEDSVFPDFWLLDLPSNRELPMEVYGLSDKKYLERKAEKTLHYAKEYGTQGWWQWDAAKDPEGLAIDPFPVPKP